MSIINSIGSQLVPIHPQGYPFIGVFALISLVLFVLWTPLGWLGTFATLWCVYFLPRSGADHADRGWPGDRAGRRTRQPGDQRGPAARACARHGAACRACRCS